MNLRTILLASVIMFATACNHDKAERMLNAEIPVLIQNRDGIAMDWHSGNSIWDVSTLHLDQNGTFDYTLSGCVFFQHAHGQWQRSPLGFILNSVEDSKAQKDYSQTGRINQTLLLHNCILFEQGRLLICSDKQSPLYGAKFWTGNRVGAPTIAEPALHMKL